MGFLKQDAPVVDYEEWSKGTRAEKIVPMARHWAEVGFGTPVVLHLFYVVKILLYVLAAWLIVLTTLLMIAAVLISAPSASQDKSVSAQSSAHALPAVAADRRWNETRTNVSARGFPQSRREDAR